MHDLPHSPRLAMFLNVDQAVGSARCCYRRKGRLELPWALPPLRGLTDHPLV